MQTEVTLQRNLQTLLIAGISIFFAGYGMPVDTRRITVSAAGILNLENEVLNLVISPRPKRTSLVSLSTPMHVTGTMAAVNEAMIMKGRADELDDVPAESSPPPNFPAPRLHTFRATS